MAKYKVGDYIKIIKIKESPYLNTYAYIRHIQGDTYILACEIHNWNDFSHWKMYIADNHSELAPPSFKILYGDQLVRN